MTANVGEGRIPGRRAAGSGPGASGTRRVLLTLTLVTVVFGAGCATAPQGTRVPEAALPAADRPDFLRERPVPEGKWREHRLSWCAEDTSVSPQVESYLGLCSEFFRDGSGSDGMIEMEFGLEAGVRHSLMLLTLGQLYLMAGQGDPDLLPVEGPAADVGDWPRNRRRLLGRARELLIEAGEARPDDAAVDYLLADVARAGGDFEKAGGLVARGMTKCTGGRSFRTMQLYQQLRNYPPRYLGGLTPVYPPEAADAGVTGDVVFDLLLSPAAEVRQAVVVSSPSADLTAAALAALEGGDFEAARIGKYPVWAWLRVTISFNLEQ
ncbi:energy transducer TonB [bacterium]|nr:energy transducer TonB [bacterium]